MLRNYLKISLRSLLKYRLTAFINLFGLTLGLACCLLILTYVLHETSYDRFNAKASRTYRITRDFLNLDGSIALRLSSVAPPFGLYLRNDFPEIERMTVLLDNGSTAVKYNEAVFNEEGLFAADERLFQVFDVPVLRGDAKTALAEPYSVMMEEGMARKYFGDGDPLNKVVRLDSRLDFRVTGTFKAWPENAHIHPKILMSFSTLRDSAIYGEEQLRTNWGNNAFLTYVVLPEGYPGSKLEARLPAFLDRHMPGTTPSKFTTLHVQPLTDIHLRSHLDDEAEPPGDITRVYIFSVIAFFILLIACINYMNLSTARASLRAKEIGVRKVIGAQRREIILQFLSESVLMAFLALALSIGVAAVAMPSLRALSGVDMRMGLLLRWEVVLPMLAAPFLVGVLSGLYPALFLSSFRPQAILKGFFKAGQKSYSFRQVLVVVQFSISIILIIATGVVLRQLNYMRQKPLGFEKDQVVILPYPEAYANRYDAFRNRLLNSPGIRQVGRSSRIPSGRLLDDMGASVYRGDSLQPTQVPIKYLGVDREFIPAYGIGMAAGRNFSKDHPTDMQGYILNEAAVQMIGWKSAQEAVGKEMSYGGRKGAIVGVMRDFHFESLHQAIVPMILMPGDGVTTLVGFNRISVKMSGANAAATLAGLESTWKQVYPEIPLTYSFLNERFEQLYQAEQRQGAIFTLFACIAIFVACLGLLGLTAFAITQRVKEIGIRKVLGASVASIAALLSKDFLRLVLVSSIIAFPIAWWAMHRWLEGFAYRTAFPWWVFLASGLATLVIALLTVASQTISVATANPVKSLRTE